MKGYWSSKGLPLKLSQTPSLRSSKPFNVLARIMGTRLSVHSIAVMLIIFWVHGFKITYQEKACQDSCQECTKIVFIIPLLSKVFHQGSQIHSSLEPSFPQAVRDSQALIKSPPWFWRKKDEPTVIVAHKGRELL